MANNPVAASLVRHLNGNGDIMSALVAHLSAEKDGRGHYHFACPECGKASSAKKYHCAMFPGQKGWAWKCFSCGTGGGLSDLARRVELDRGDYSAPEPVKPLTKEPARWLSNGDYWLDKFSNHPGVLRGWQAYKPLEAATIQAARLGIGALPASKCPHVRLVLPVLDGTLLVGLRGRAMTPEVAEAAGVAYHPCDCGKWVVSGGTDMAHLPLYNAQNVKPGCEVWIVENPVDALEITEAGAGLIFGVAMYSTAYWRPFEAGQPWHEALRKVKPSAIVIALDNDLVGNGGANRRKEFIKLWQEACRANFVKSNPGKPVPDRFPIPIPAAARILNSVRILTSVQILDWRDAPHKADIASTYFAKEKVT